jgi:hypothetical protein
MRVNQSMLSQSVFRTALWMSLGAWVGSWAFFAFVVSRIAFQILPGDVAGNLAGSLLTILHYGGAAAAFVAAGSAAALGRRGWVVALPVGLALICLASEFWISPEIAAVRPSTIGEASTLQSGERFRLLHRLSIGLFLAVHFASILLVGLNAKLDARLARVDP